VKASKTISKDGRPQYKLDTVIDWVVPGDIHLPFHDPVALSKLPRATGLFITGDLLDYYWLSSWPKLADKVKKAGYTATREAAKDFVAWIHPRYKYKVFGAGNHELRIETLSRKYPGFDGTWYWMFADILPKTWIYLDHGYRCILPQKTVNGLPIVLEHGDRTLYGGVPSAERLVNGYPGQCTVIGHNHRLQSHFKTTWNVGKSTVTQAYTVGHLSDIKKNNYASNPNWQQGFGTISEQGSIRLFAIDKGAIINGPITKS